MEKFKPGDLVRIKDGTHQDGMPDHRVGMIVEAGETSKSYTKAFTVVFVGTDIRLKFHAMFLEHFTSP
jgi:ribosomal protein L21E